MKRLLLAVLLVLVVGCTDDEGGEGDGGRLVIAGGALNENSLTFRLAPDEQFLVGGIPVCPEDAPVVVTSVEAEGMEVTGYSLRPNPFKDGGEMVLSARGTLEESGLVRGGGELDELCGDESEFYELIVELRAGDQDATAEGYGIKYDGGSLSVPYSLNACVNLSSPECEDAPDLPAT